MTYHYQKALLIWHQLVNREHLKTAVTEDQWTAMVLRLYRKRADSRMLKGG